MLHMHDIRSNSLRCHVFPAEWFASRTDQASEWAMESRSQLAFLARFSHFLGYAEMIGLSDHAVDHSSTSAQCRTSELNANDEQLLATRRFRFEEGVAQLAPVAYALTRLAHCAHFVIDSRRRLTALVHRSFDSYS